jgi:GNAT superfamily N-acetyltransferase
MADRIDAAAIALRDFRPEDLELVLELRARVFPASDFARERRRWRWEFDENPFRSQVVPCSWVFELDGRVVGNYGLVPAPVAIDRKVQLCFNGIDFAIEPDLQGLGLGHRIIERHFDPALCPFPFLTAPTPAVQHLCEKHGGTIVRCASEPSVYAFRCASPAPTPRPPREVALRPIAGFEPRFDELFHRVSERHRILVARDHRYLNWRYRDYPFGRPHPMTMISALGRDGLLRGFLVLQHDRAKNAGFLLELFADPREEWVFQGLIAGAIDAGRVAGLHEIWCLNRVEPVRRLLQSNGFEEVEGHSLTLACRLPPPTPGAAPFAAADVYWSAGDGDLLYGIGEWTP